MRRFSSLFIAVSAVILFTPAFSHAAEDLEVAGWIPYWNDSRGIKDAKKHIDDIDAVYPFAFTVTTNGELRDQAGLTHSEWRRFVKDSQKKGVEVIPTVMWADGASIHKVLSDEDLRKEHIDEIVSMVKKGKFDGVGIDYESKWAETINYFSLFIEELKAELGSKILTCTLEARTPPDSLYEKVPKVIKYSYDYDELKKHCDRVELMAYDQQRADLKLNKKRTGLPYMPVSDPEWVEKVVKLALKDFDEDQVILGIPTYGYHYTVTVAPNWYKSYTRIGALNMPDILEVADEYNVTPGRNSHGEMSFTYFPDSSPYKVLDGLDTPKGTPKGYEAAAKALLFANMTGTEVQVRLATYSDAGAMKQKIDLAKKYSLRGVALFKFDGEEDQKVWDYLGE